MSDQIKPRTNPARTIVSTLKKHDRKILVVALTASVAGNVLMRTGIAQHNAFLKEHGLYETFYSTTPEA